MDEESKKFSIGTVVTSAVISFLISGVGGAFIQKYVSRAKPEITVTSAGFEGTSDYIEIPADLQKLSEEDAWGKSIAKYEKFDKLRSREEDAADTEARLLNGIALTESWLRETTTTTDQLTKSELLKHPLFVDATFGSSINGAIRRQELQPPPAIDLTLYQTLFPIFKNSDGDPLVHTGRFGVSFPTKRFMDQRMHDANRLFAESFSKGLRMNVLHYTNQFLEFERTNLLANKKLRERLKIILLEQSRPTLTIVVHNAGDSPVAFRPYFGMNVLAADGKTVSDSYLMLPEKTSSIANTTDSAGILASLIANKGEGGDDDAAKQVKVEPYLPRVGGLAYSTISPGATQTLRLVATAKMGGKAAQYRSAYDSGLLNTQILGLTASGESVWSAVSIFGANVNKATEDDLLQRLK